MERKEAGRIGVGRRGRGRREIEGEGRRGRLGEGRETEDEGSRRRGKTEVRVVRETWEGRTRGRLGERKWRIGEKGGEETEDDRRRRGSQGEGRRLRSRRACCMYGGILDRSDGRWWP